MLRALMGYKPCQPPSLVNVRIHIFGQICPPNKTDFHRSWHLQNNFLAIHFEWSATQQQKWWSNFLDNCLLTSSNHSHKNHLLFPSIVKLVCFAFLAEEKHTKFSKLWNKHLFVNVTDKHLLPECHQHLLANFTRLWQSYRNSSWQLRWMQYFIASPQTRDTFDHAGAHLHKPHAGAHLRKQ